MKCHIGKKCNIHVKVKGKDLFYNALVIDVLEGAEHSIITFVDKYDKHYSYGSEFIVEISEQNGWLG